MQLTRRMDHERSGRNRHTAARGVHCASAPEAEIDLRCTWMTMIGADLARLPACHGDIAFPGGAEYLFDMPLWIEFLLGQKVKDLHGYRLLSERCELKIAPEFHLVVLPGSMMP